MITLFKDRTRKAEILCFDRTEENHRRNVTYCWRLYSLPGDTLERSACQPRCGLARPIHGSDFALRPQIGFGLSLSLKYSVNTPTRPIHVIHVHPRNRVKEVGLY